MLNECLKKESTDSVGIRDCRVRVGDTGMPSTDSLNLGPKRLAKERHQRMRRRHDRALFQSNSRLGWATRMM